MEPEITVNGSYTLYDIHPCFELDNTTYSFTSQPSTICVLVYMFLSLLSVATICGNLLVIISIIYFKQLHTPTNYLILSLAVADMLVGVLVFPLSMIYTINSCLYHEDVFCKVRDCFDVALSTSSILNLCCISIDRYYAICHPLTYKSTVTVDVARIMILVIWSIAALIGIGVTVGGFCQGTCEEMFSVDVVLSNIMGPILAFYFPAIIMLCIYVKIFLVAQKQAINIQSTKSGVTANKMEKKATKTLAIVMGIFLLCMTPFFICVVFQPLASDPPSFSLIEALNWLTLSNSMLNPFIYAFFYSWFRSACSMIISGKIFLGNFTNTRLF